MLTNRYVTAVVSGFAIQRVRERRLYFSANGNSYNFTRAG